MAKKESERQLFFRLDAQYRFLIALIVAIAAFFITRSSQTTPSAILMVWVAFAFTVIVMDWIIILTSHPQDVRKNAKLQDSNRTFIFLFVIASSIMSLGAIVFLLISAKGKSGEGVAFPVILALASVLVSWWLVHTLFTLRYAHLYYEPEHAQKPVGGLEFPGDEKEPDYLDFVYFSFVIGMTFQVSDVEISSKRIRRLALFHALIAFAFNTAIVALSINIIAGLM